MSLQRQEVLKKFRAISSRQIQDVFSWSSASVDPYNKILRVVVFFSEAPSSLDDAVGKHPKEPG